MDEETKALSKQISLNTVYAVCEIEIKQAKEAKEKALENKDLNQFTFQEGKLHCASQIKNFIKSCLEELC